PRPRLLRHPCYLAAPPPHAHRRRRLLYHPLLPPPLCPRRKNPRLPRRPILLPSPRPPRRPRPSRPRLEQNMIAIQRTRALLQFDASIFSAISSTSVTLSQFLPVPCLFRILPTPA